MADENKKIATVEGIKAVREEFQERLEDGRIVPELSATADNFTPVPMINDSPYTSGATGGLADIFTGEEAYLNQVYGLTVIWNQLLDNEEHTSYTTLSQRIYLARKLDQTWELIVNQTKIVDRTVYRSLFDLNLMFGYETKIPFSLVDEVEYQSNGEIPEQKVTVGQKFQRLFANTDLWNAPYDSGTPKNVTVTKLVETGQNLWKYSLMNTNGLQLLAGYRYEIYLDTTGTYDRSINVSYDGGSSWHRADLQRAVRASDAQCIWYFYPQNNCLIKSDIKAITYVGFVHSGNHCLTTGTNYGYSAKTTLNIPNYKKYEFELSDLSNLNGLMVPFEYEYFTARDTRDYRRVGVFDLSEIQEHIVSEDNGWFIPKEYLPSDMIFDSSDWVDYGYYLVSEGLQSAYQNGYYMELYNNYENDDEELIGLWIAQFEPSGEIKPSGTIFYPLSEPVATGLDPFTPIALKSGDTWIVDDMGSEYFIQPANTNCPVNQVSYYYENLKDKLVNLQIPTIEPITGLGFSRYANSLNGLIIDGKQYNVVPPGQSYDASNIVIGYTADARGSDIYQASRNVVIGEGAKIQEGNYSDYIVGNVAIGDYSFAGNGSNNTAIGRGAYAISSCATAIGSDSDAYNECSTAIGFYAKAGANGAIAIGYNTRNSVPDSVTFDSDYGDHDRIFICRDPQHILFRMTDNELGDDLEYYENHGSTYLSQFIKKELLQDDVFDSETGFYKFYISRTDNNNYHTVTKKVVSGQVYNVWLSGEWSIVDVNIILLKDSVYTSTALKLPLQLSRATPVKAYGRCLVGSNTIDDIIAFIDSDGVVNILPPSGATIDEVTFTIE